MTKTTQKSFYYKATRDIINTILWMIFAVVLFCIFKKIGNCEIQKGLEKGYSMNADRLLLSIFLKIYAGIVLLLIISSFVNIFVRTYRKLIINQNEIIYKTGWLTKQTTIIPANKIRTCSQCCGILQRACGTQDISITTAGDTAEITFGNIANGDEAYKLISQLCRGVQ